MKKMILVDADTVFSGGHNRGPMPYDELRNYKRWKKFLKKEQEEAKKSSPKGGWWNSKTVGERTVILTIFGPPLGICYIALLLMLVKAVAVAVGVH